MAGLTGLEGRGRGLLVAKLTDEDDVGILAKNATQGLLEGGRVEADLALRDDAALVVMHDLDRIFDRDNVI